MSVSRYPGLKPAVPQIEIAGKDRRHVTAVDTKDKIVVRKARAMMNGISNTTCSWTSVRVGILRSCLAISVFAHEVKHCHFVPT